jgi:hypothetical protein
MWLAVIAKPLLILKGILANQKFQNFALFILRNKPNEAV